MRNYLERWYYSWKVGQIKKQMKKTEYPPQYNPEEWNLLNISPYAYVLNLKVSDIWRKVMLPGRISNSRASTEICSETELRKRIEADLDFLGYNYREDMIECFEDEWKIAIYYNKENHSFHFARQDKCGLWSEKVSWNSEVKPCRSPKMPAKGHNQSELVTVMVIIK